MIEPLFLGLFSLVAVLPIVYILITKNIIRAVFALSASFLGLAGIYVMLGAEFMAVVQILIYIGGILVLIVFGLMLTKTTLNEGFITTHRSPVLGALISAVLFILLISWVREIENGKHTLVITGDPIRKIGVAYLTEYIVSFELVAFLLLVALVGASYLAKKSEA